MDQERRIGLKWKIGGIYTAVMVILSVLVIGATYRVTQGILRDQLSKRALTTANNLSGAAAGPMVERNLLALSALAGTYAVLDGAS